MGPRIVDGAFGRRIGVLDGPGHRHGFGGQARPGPQPVSERPEGVTVHGHHDDGSAGRGDVHGAPSGRSSGPLGVEGAQQVDVATRAAMTADQVPRLGAEPGLGGPAFHPPVDVAAAHDEGVEVVRRGLQCRVTEADGAALRNVMK
jgi:hypothetical protein